MPESVQDIRLRIEDFNSTFGPSTLEVFGLPESETVDRGFWEEIRDFFDTHPGLNEFLKTIPDEFRQFEVCSFQGPLWDWLNDLPEAPVPGEKSRDEFYALLTLKYTSIEKMNPLSGNLTLQSVAASPMAFLRYLEKWREEGGKGTGAEGLEDSSAALNRRAAGAVGGGGGGRGGQGGRVGSYATLLSHPDRMLPGFTRVNRKAFWTVSSDPIHRDLNKGFGSYLKHEVPFGGNQRSSAPGGQFSRILSRLPEDVRSSVAPHLPALLESIREGGREGASGYVKNLRIHKFIDEKTFRSLLNAIDIVDAGQYGFGEGPRYQRDTGLIPDTSGFPSQSSPGTLAGFYSSSGFVPTGVGRHIWTSGAGKIISSRHPDIARSKQGIELLKSKLPHTDMLQRLPATFDRDTRRIEDRDSLVPGPLRWHDSFLPAKKSNKAAGRTIVRDSLSQPRIVKVELNPDIYETIGQERLKQELVELFKKHSRKILV